VKRGLRIVGSIALLGVIAWRIDLGEVTRTLASVGWHWWLAALGCYLVAQVVSSVRWQWLACPLGFGHSLDAYVGYYFVGNFFNLILPTSIGGDVARAWYLARGTGLGPGAALSVLAAPFLGVAVMLGLAFYRTKIRRPSDAGIGTTFRFTVDRDGHATVVPLKTTARPAVSIARCTAASPSRPWARSSRQRTTTSSA